MPTPEQGLVTFPDPALIVSYNDCLRYIQHRLHNFAHGQLKVWAKDQGVNYTSLITLKNVDSPRKAPSLIHQTLRALGFEVDIMRLAFHEVHSVFFVFPSKPVLDDFAQQLAAYDRLNTLEPSKGLKK